MTHSLSEITLLPRLLNSKKRLVSEPLGGPTLYEIRLDANNYILLHKVRFFGTQRSNGMLYISFQTNQESTIHIPNIVEKYALHVSGTIISVNSIYDIKSISFIEQLDILHGEKKKTHEKYSQEEFLEKYKNSLAVAFDLD